MKKKFVILLSLIFLLSCTLAVSACGDKKKDNTPVKYTVTFAGEQVTTPEQKINKGETALEPKEPVWEGYTFDYWYLTDENTAYDFSTLVTSDITLTAHWTKNKPAVDPSKISGEGTKENPYLIECAQHLSIMAQKVNAGEEAYKEAHFTLTDDIDLTGYSYTPIGTLDNPFNGYFDGLGHSIKNLSLTPIVRSEGLKVYGVFGATLHSEIKNLNIENVHIDFQSYKDGANAGAFIGALAGRCDLSNVSAVTVTGSISSFTMADNSMYIGGLVGTINNSSNENAYISYVQNCLVDVQMSIDEDGGEKGDLSNATVGGIAGMVNNYNCTVAIINNAVYGKVYGGVYTGGIVGYTSNTLSIMDCMCGADVEATATQGALAGGIVGASFGDSAIVDCISTGNVKAPASTDATYKSSAGGIVGRMYTDDYEIYFTPGTLTSNCYYTGNITADSVTKIGNNDYSALYFNNLSNIVKKVGWNESCWTLNEKVIPTQTTAAQAQTSYTLTLKSEGENDVILQKETDGDGAYGLIGTLDEPESKNSMLFWAWMMDGQSESQYRFYLPVIKNMTLNAKWQDISGVVGPYKGTGTLHSSYDAGSIILESDGTLKWINTSIITGTYKYDGNHVILNVNSNIGETSGTLGGGSLVFMVEEGISGTVTYEFTAYQPKIIGEYISDRGDLLTFAGDNKVSFESSRYSNGAYFDGTYTADDNNDLLLSISRFSVYSAMKVIIDSDDAITLSYTEGGQQKTEIFKKIRSLDYSSEGFVGKYSYVYMSSNTYCNELQFEFKPDGTAIMTSLMDTIGRYYYIESLGLIKVIMEGYVSNFTYDKDEDIVYGNFVRGMGTTYRPVVMTKLARGKQSGYTNYEFSLEEKSDVELFVFTVPDGGYYIFKNEVFLKGQTVEGNIADGEDFVFEGQKYRIIAYDICEVGNEEGDYTYNNYTIHLDGLTTATVVNSTSGNYYYIAYNNTDNLVVILYENDEIIAFDYQAAKNNGGVAAKLTPHDDYQGVWYEAYKDNNYYYKLVIDGFGNTTIFYTKEGEYALNWGGSGWGTYTVTASGICASFNSAHQGINITFYYDKNLAYTDNYPSGETSAFVKKGYTGSQLPPELPAESAGSYVCETESGQIVFNLKGDLTGTYKGSPIYNVVYDGKGKVYFTCNSIDYSFTLSEGGGTLNSVEGQLVFTSAGAVTEIIPADICGRWTGVFTGYGASETDKRGFIIEADGTIKYLISAASGSTVDVSGVQYDSATFTITFTVGSGESAYYWTLVYDVENHSITANGRDEENRTLSATLTKE